MAERVAQVDDVALQITTERGTILWFAGSDRSRIQTLRTRLTPDEMSWTVLSGQDLVDATTSLEILSDEN